MKKIFFIALAISIILSVDCMATNYYSIDIINKNDSLALESKSVILSEFDIFDKWEIGEYLAELKAFDNATINYTYFDSFEMILIEGIDKKTGDIGFGEKIIIQKQNISLVLPYYPDADKVVISKVNQSSGEKTKVLEIDVSMFAKERFVAKEAGESPDETGPQGVPEKTEPPEGYAKDKPGWRVIVIGAVLIILLIIVFAFIKKRR